MQADLVRRAAQNLLKQLAIYADAQSDSIADDRWHFDVCPARTELAQALECPVAHPVQPVATQHRVRAKNLGGEWSEWRDGPAYLSDNALTWIEAETRDLYATPQPASAGPVVALEALRPFAAFAEKARRFVQGRADFGGSPIMPTKNFRLADFERAEQAVAILSSSPTPVGVSEANETYSLNAPLIERLERASAIIANDDYTPPMTESRARRVFVTETIIEAEAALRSQSPAPKEQGCHPSHKTRMSDASSYDEICVNCGATDTIGGWGRLAEPCPSPESGQKPGERAAQGTPADEQSGETSPAPKEPAPGVTEAEDETFPSLDEAFDAAFAAMKTYADAASVEETNWTGWGEQIVPPHAAMRRVKADQALSALRDSDPRRAQAAMAARP